MQDLLYPFYQSDRFVKVVPRIKASDITYVVVRDIVSLGMLLPIGVELTNFRIRTRQEADYVLGIMNSPTLGHRTLTHIQGRNQPWQQFTYVPSNLGRGYIFSFICNHCLRSVRYLHLQAGLGEYRCQYCSGMKYISQYH